MRITERLNVEHGVYLNLVPEKQLTALCDWSTDHLRERAGRTHRSGSAE